MNSPAWFKPVVAIVLIAFGAFSTWATVFQDGYWSVFPPFASWSETQMFCDLTLALSLFLLWSVFDLMRQGRSPWLAGLVAVGIGALGSIAALAYLLVRKSDRRAYESNEPGALASRLPPPHRGATD